MLMFTILVMMEAVIRVTVSLDYYVIFYSDLEVVIGTTQGVGVGHASPPHILYLTSIHGMKH